MSEQNAFDETIGAAKPTSLRIDKLRDGGFLVGNPHAATFACTKIGDALGYIAKELMPAVEGESSKSDLIDRLRKTPGTIVEDRYGPIL